MAMPEPRIKRGTTKFAKPPTVSQAVRRPKLVPEPDPPMEGDDDKAAAREQTKATLADMVNNRIREAINARASSGIEEEWREADDLFNGTDELNQVGKGMPIPDKQPGIRKDGVSATQSTLLVNIIKPKTKTVASRIKEMLVPTNDRPFDVKNTPDAELEGVKEDPLQAGQMVTLGDGTQAPALAVVEMMQEKASQGAKKEATWIDDTFVEGKVYAEMRRVIDDATQRGTGCLKGPIPICKTVRRFEKQAGTNVVALVREEKRTPTSRRIRIQDCFPDPACGDNVHDGEYFNERDYMNGRALKRLARDPTYDAAAIAQALIEGPRTYAMLFAGDTRSRTKTGNMINEAALFEVWYSYGDCTADALIAMGVKDKLLGNLEPTQGTGYSAEGGAVDGNEDPQDAMAAAEAAFDPASAQKKAALTREQRIALASIPTMVTMVNGRAIQATILPLESGEFPYDFFRYEPVDGQPWGKGLPMTMRAAQVILKASVRRMLENAGMSSGPQIAIADCIQPMDKQFSVDGRKLWRFVPNELIKDIRAAMAVFDIPSMQKELMAIITFALDLADRLSNVPMLMQGDQQAGTAPETLGGLKMFESNAMSPLRDIAKQYDDDLIIPHLGRYHEWWMEHVPGDKSDSDTEIQALGSTALVQREEGRQFLLSLFAVKDDPDLRIDPKKYDKELARAHGYDMSLIQYSDDEWKQIQQQKAAPPEDPSVTRAKIMAESQQSVAKTRAATMDSAEQARSVHEEEDRKLRVAELEIVRETKMLELSLKTGASLQDIKKDLVIAAATIRLQRDKMQMDAASPHQGI